MTHPADPNGAFLRATRETQGKAYIPPDSAWQPPESEAAPTDGGFKVVEGLKDVIFVKTVGWDWLVDYIDEPGDPVEIMTVYGVMTAEEALEEGRFAFEGFGERMKAAEIVGVRRADLQKREAAATAAEPDFATSIADTIAEESAGGAECGWLSCTGCHETNEGTETGRDAYSKMFKAYAGSGCRECGGLGVVWHHMSKADLDEMASPYGFGSPTAAE